MQMTKGDFIPCHESVGLVAQGMLAGSSQDIIGGLNASS